MIRRGEPWRADLGAPQGSAPALPRPVLVVSIDAYTRSRIARVICLTITSNLRLADAPGNVRAAAGTSGLSKDSVVNVSQAVTLNKSHLEDRLGALDRRILRGVDSGLRLALGL